MTMAGETLLTVVGNLTGDPELRFTASGIAVASFTIASTPRAFDKNSNEWKDGEALFMRCSIWRDAAENVASSLVKGARVIAQGRLVQRSFETREGEKRSVIELQVEEIGPSLRYASAQVTKTARSGGSGGFGGNASTAASAGGGNGFGQAAGYGLGGQDTPQNDPWANQAPATDEPPF